MKQNILIILGIIFLTLFVYGGITETFYQQDEWNTLGHILAKGPNAFFEGQSILDLLGGSGRILSFPIYYFFYTYFPFQSAPFIIFSLLFQSLNTIILFFFAKKLTRSTLISFIASCFFITVSTSQQAVVWMAASTTVLPSVFFVLLSLYFYLDFVQKRSTFYLFAASIFAIISYYFRESSIFVFFLFPLLYLLYAKKKGTFISIVKTHWFLIGFACLLVFSRLFGLFFVNQGLTDTFVTRNDSAEIRILSHVVLYPLTSFSQAYIYPGDIWPLSYSFTEINYPRIAEGDFLPIVAETVTAELITLSISIVLLALCVFLYKSEIKHRKELLFSLIFLLISFLPYVILDKGTAYLESRYFYPGQIGAAILFGIVVVDSKSLFNKYFKKGALIAYGVFLLLVLFYLNHQIDWVRKEIGQQALLASERRSFIEEIREKTKLEKENVFFVTGSQDYYIPGNKVPFTQGLGFTLMALFYKHGSIPGEFLTNNYFWDLREQGYYKKGDLGFGFYREIEKLSEDAVSDKFTVNAIKAFYYQADTKELIEITEQVREDIIASQSAMKN